MQGGEETVDGLDPVEAVEAERNDRDSDSVDVVYTVEDLEMLPVAEGKAEIRIGVVHRQRDTPDRRRETNTVMELRRGFGQHDNARIFQREPEDRGIRRWDQRADGEIATPTAAGCVPSAVRGLHGQRPMLQNLRHKRRCGEAIPRPDRMLSAHPDDRIPPKNAMSMRQESSQPSKFNPKGQEDSEFPCRLSCGSQVEVNR